MSNDVEQVFILEKEEKDGFEFKVYKPTIIKWIVIFLISFFCNFTWVFVLRRLGPVFALLIPLILIGGAMIFAIVIWIFFGTFLSKKLLFDTIELLVEEQESREFDDDKPGIKLSFIRKAILRIIGVSFSTNYDYFIEEKCNPINLSKIRELMTKQMYEVTISCLSIGFLIATLVSYPVEQIITYTGADAGFIIILVAVLIIIGTPTVVGMLIPSIWLVRDARIKYIKDTYEVESMYDDIKKGALSRFLSISGAIAGISFIYAQIERFNSANNWNLTLSAIYGFTLAFFILVLILVSGISLLVAVIYLRFFHQNSVQSLRNEISKLLPVCETNAKIIYFPDTSEIQ